MRTLELAESLRPDLVDLRRRLHQVPELGLELPITQSLVLEALEGLDLEVSVGKELSSVTAVLRGRGGDTASSARRPVVLLRGDMDALPVTEDLDLDYAPPTRG